MLVSITRLPSAEQPEPFRALHLADEILDRLGIGEVALERGRGQEEVVADEPRDGLGFGGVETETGAELQSDLGPDFAVIAATPLGDVVKQHRRIEDPARADLLHDCG